MIRVAYIVGDWVILAVIGAAGIWAARRLLGLGTHNA